MNLRDDLHRVADGAPLEPIAMAGIRAKARSIRRRRAGAAAGGAALGVAAIAAAAVLLVPGGADRTNPLPASQSPTPTATTMAPTITSPTDQPSRAAASYTVNLTSAPAERTTGASLAVPNWMSGMLTDAHGNAAAIPTPVSHAWQGASGDWYGMTFAQGSWTWTRWSVRGTKLSSRPAPSGRVAVTPDGKQAAVMLMNGQAAEIDVYDTGQQAPTVIALSLPAGEPQNGAGVDGILPNGDIVFEGQPGDVRIAHRNGSITSLPGGFSSVAAVSPSGRMVVHSDHLDDYVAEDGTGPVLLGSDGGQREYAFNADGSMVAIATASTAPRVELDGTGGSDQLPLLPQATFAFPQGSVVDTGDGAWMGGSYVVPVWSGGTWRLVWLATDGYRITRSLAQAGPSSTSPYLLGAGPLTSTNP